MLANVISTLTLIVTVIGLGLTFLGLDPATLPPRLQNVGMLLEPYTWLFKPLVVLLVILILLRKYGRRLGQDVRARIDAYLLELIAAQRPARSAHDDAYNIRMVVESIIKTPNQLDTLAGQMGIGPATTSKNSVSARLQTLEGKVEDTRKYKGRIALLEFELENLSSEVKKLESFLRDRVLNTQRYFDLSDRYDKLSYLTSLVMSRPNLEHRSWREWYSCRDTWRERANDWLRALPIDASDSDVRACLNVSASEWKAAADRFPDIGSATDTERHDFLEAYAAGTNFNKLAPAALQKLREETFLFDHTEFQ